MVVAEDLHRVRQQVEPLFLRDASEEADNESLGTGFLPLANTIHRDARTNRLHLAKRVGQDRSHGFDLVIARCNKTIDLFRVSGQQFVAGRSIRFAQACQKVSFSLQRADDRYTQFSLDRPGHARQHRIRQMDDFRPNLS